MSHVDMTLVVCRDGSVWHEAHWLEQTTLDCPEPERRVVAIRDGTGEPPPFLVWVVPDREIEP